MWHLEHQSRQCCVGDLIITVPLGAHIFPQASTSTHNVNMLLLIDFQFSQRLSEWSYVNFSLIFPDSPTTFPHFSWRFSSFSLRLTSNLNIAKWILSLLFLSLLRKCRSPIDKPETIETCETFIPSIWTYVLVNLRLISQSFVSSSSAYSLLKPVVGWDWPEKIIIRKSLFEKYSRKEVEGDRNETQEKILRQEWIIWKSYGTSGDDNRYEDFRLSWSRTYAPLRWG